MATAATGGERWPEDGDPAELRARLRHVLWLGGGSAAGKSTIAQRLAAHHGLRVYATDDVMADHARRSTARGSPALHAFMAMDMDERWVDRSPEAMLATFPWFHGECFGLIVDDLLRLPAEPRVLVEGFRLLPHLVAPLVDGPGRAVWLLPTPAFRRAAAARRGGWRFLDRTSDPETGLRNVLERDRLFTERLREEIGRLGMAAIEIDTTTTEDHVADRVRASLGL